MENNYSIYTFIQSKKIVFLMIVITGLLLSMIALHIFTALISAVILYTLFRPLFLFFVLKKRWNKSLSALTIIAISFLIIVLPLTGLSVMIVNKLIHFQQHPEALTNVIGRLHDYLGTGFDIKTTVKNSINDISKWALNAFSVFLSSAVKVFVALIILYFTLFYMFKSYEKLEASLLKYLPFNIAQSLKFGEELKNITLSNILGQGMIGLCQGMIVAVGFLIFGIPDALFWGTVSVFVCFLPVVGAPIVFVPAAIFELSSGNNFAGFGVLIWGGVLVTLVDNFLRQFISKKIADTHPLITIIGVIIGIPFFGLIGLVVGPFIISFFILLFKTYEENYLNSSKPNSITTQTSDNEHHIQ